MFNYLVTKLHVDNVIVRYILLFIDIDTFYDKWCDKLIRKKQKRFRTRCVQKMLFIHDTKFPAIVKTTYNNNSSESISESISEEDNDFLPVANEQMKEDTWDDSWEDFWDDS